MLPTTKQPQISLKSLEVLVTQATLGEILVTRFYNQSDAAIAKAEFSTIFSKGGLPEDIPEISISTVAEMRLVDFLVQFEILSSKKEVRRLISQGAVSIDNDRISDEQYQFFPKVDQVIKIGKRRFYRLTK